MAFPAYTMLSAHQMMETYVGEGAFTGHHLGSIKLMQLFQAFPADLCEDALSPAVLDALTSIKDAKSAKLQVTAQQILDTESLDGLDFAHEEQKNHDTDTGHTAASTENDSDLITELKKHSFTELPATRFFAYSIMNDEQIQAMDAFNSHLEAIEKSAYVHRFELSVSESSLDFTQLKLTLQDTAAATSSAFATASSAAPAISIDPIASLKNRFRSKSGASDAGAAALNGLLRKQSNNRLLDSSSGDARDALPTQPTAADPAAPDTANSVGAGDTKILNVFSVNPVNLALHRNSSCCTPIQVSLEVQYINLFD